jgi:uncharacterized protein (UPF0262 family)
VSDPDRYADPCHRICNIQLDERLVLRRNPDIEQERAVAIYDLIEEHSHFRLDGKPGPYDLLLGIQESRLVIDVRDRSEAPLARIVLALRPFRKIVRDYFTLCESYFDAIKRLSPSQIEAIDMGRRGLHDEGSEMLRDHLGAQVEIDRETARRLFTLICVLHLRPR